MHEVEVKSILSASNGMNIYRGCSHGCIYCDARSTCYQMNHRFEDIEVKKNVPELLERALRSKRNHCMIGTGGMSDPYMHIEERLRLTHRCLKIIAEYGHGVAIQTKSDRILQDLDLLDRIHRTAKCVVQITLTTFDDALCHIVEPNVCPTSDRLHILQIMQEHHIPTVVWMTPLLPFINDTEDNVTRIVDACGQYGVKGIITFGMGLTLRDGNREYYYQKLDQHFPGLKKRYIQTYGNAYELPSPNTAALARCFYAGCRKYGIETDTDQIFAYLHRFECAADGEQLDLFDFYDISNSFHTYHEF